MGWFGSIKEVRSAAKILKMSVRKFAKKYLIREWHAGKDEIMVPAPRKNFNREPKAIKEMEVEGRDAWKDEKLRNGKGFILASWGHNLMTGFACIFLTKDERCGIHKSKPTECRESFACKKSSFNKRKPLLSYWKKHQDFIRYLTE